MAKKKKTREQKILADKRRETLILSSYSLPEKHFKKQTEEPTIQAKQNVTIATTSYQYLADDLRKTTIFTGLIILTELLLRFFAK